MNAMSRRHALAFMAACGLSPWLARADQEKPPRTDQVLWGGLGFSIPGGETAINHNFPYTMAVFNRSEGMVDLIKAVTTTLAEQYPGGVAEDPMHLLESSSDPGLIFSVSLDYEQVILVPHQVRTDIEYQISYLYGTAQVLYFDIPQSGGRDGNLRILYSFPFRVSRGETARVNQVTDRVDNVARLLNGFDQSLVATFAKKIAKRRFVELAEPKRLRVRSVTLSERAKTTMQELSIENELSSDFIGQAFSSSLGHIAEVSVLPHGHNDTLNRALSSRFNKFPNMTRLFSRLADEDMNDYVIDLTVHGLLRESNGSSVGNVLYARGISIWVKVTDVNKSNEVVFNEKILLIEEHELAKRLLNRLRDYDLNYFVQVTIALFDTFIQGLVLDNKELLTKVSINRQKSLVGLTRFRDILQACRYI